MLGVIIGNASVIAMVAVGQGGQRYINQQFESLGTNILFIIPGVDQRGPQAGVVQVNTLVLEDAEAIAQEVLAIIVATLSPLEAVVSFQAIMIALTVSGAIGLFFGVFPARNAAQLDPIIALRS